MANEFQPQLGQPSGVSGPSGSFSPIDTRSVDRTINTIGLNFKKSRQDAESQATTDRFAQFAMDRTDLQIQRNNVVQLEQDLTSLSNRLYADNKIDDNEKADADILKRDLGRLAQAQRQIGPLQFQTKLQQLIKEAIGDNRNLAPVLKTLFTGENLFKDRAQEAADLQTQQITASLDSVYGEGRWSAKEFSEKTRENAILAASGLSLPEFHARAIMTQLPMTLAASTSDWSKQTSRMASDNGGFLKPQQLEEQLALLGQAEALTTERVNKDLAERSAKGSPISIADQESIRKKNKDHFDDIRSNIGSKDFLKALKADVELQQLSFEHNNPQIVSLGKAISKSGTVDDAIDLISILKNEQIAKGVMSAGAAPGLEESGLSLETLMASLYKGIVEGSPTPNDPVLAKRRAALSAILTKQGKASTGLGKANNEGLDLGTGTVDEIANATTPEALGQFTNKIEDNLLALSDEEFSINHLRNLNSDETTKSQFSRLSGKWLSSTLRSVDKDLLREALSGGKSAFVWNRGAKQFIFKAGDLSKADQFTRRQITASMPKELRILNSFLRLAQDSPLSPVLPSVEKIISDMEKEVEEVEVQATPVTFEEALHRKSMEEFLGMTPKEFEESELSFSEILGRSSPGSFFGQDRDPAKAPFSGPAFIPGSEASNARKESLRIKRESEAK